MNQKIQKEEKTDVKAIKGKNNLKREGIKEEKIIHKENPKTKVKANVTKKIRGKIMWRKKKE